MNNQNISFTNRYLSYDGTIWNHFFDRELARDPSSHMVDSTFLCRMSCIVTNDNGVPTSWTRHTPQKCFCERLCKFVLLLSFIVLMCSLSGCGKKPLTKKESFHPNGSIWEQWYEDAAGLKNGKALTYYNNGQLQTEAVFVNGYLHGEFVMWSRDGTEICRGTYKDGEPWSGTFVSVEEAQQRVAFSKYDQGRLVQ